MADAQVDVGPGDDVEHEGGELGHVVVDAQRAVGLAVGEDPLEGRKKHRSGVAGRRVEVEHRVRGVVEPTDEQPRLFGQRAQRLDREHQPLRARAGSRDRRPQGRSVRLRRGCGEARDERVARHAPAVQRDAGDPGSVGNALQRECVPAVLGHDRGGSSEHRVVDTGGTRLPDIRDHATTLALYCNTECSICDTYIVHERGVLRGGVGALAGVGAAELVGAATRASLLDGMGRLIIDAGPRTLVDTVVRLLGARDKTAIRTGVVLGAVSAGALASRAGERRRNATLVALSAASAAAALRRPPRRPIATLAAVGLGAVVTRRAATSATGVAGQLGLAAFGAGALVASRALRHRRVQAWDDHRGGALPTVALTDGAEAWPGVSPLIVPVDDFYITDVNMEPPDIVAARWRLHIAGLVGEPQTLSMDDLMALPGHDFCAAMVCIHNPVGGHRVGNAAWRGVQLLDVLAHVAALPHATAVTTIAADGFRVTLPMDVLRERDAYIVTHMNGVPLTAVHGGPARVFTPGIYGQYTGAKWLTGLTVTDEPEPDYWTPRGWPQHPVPVRPSARIDTPGEGSTCGRQLSVAGVAWAPPAGLDGVEVRVDGGEWRSAELARELSPLAWRRWRATLDLREGEHTLEARALPRIGAPQTGVSRPPYPSGATGLHAIHVTCAPTHGAPND